MVATPQLLALRKVQRKLPAQWLEMSSQPTTASLSTNLSPLWMLAADCRIRRVFRPSQKSKLTLMSKECDSWTETTSSHLQNPIIIQVSAYYYSRHVYLISEPRKQNVKILCLGRLLDLRPLKYLGEKILTEQASDKIFKESAEKTSFNDLDLKINILGKNETILVDCSDASNGTHFVHWGQNVSNIVRDCAHTFFKQ